MMRAGVLDTKVSLFDIAYADDGAGGATLSSSANADAPEVWASIAPANWRQQEMAARREQRIDHVVTIRWMAELASGFGPDARLSFVDRAGTTRWLAVKTVVDPDNRGRWLELGCLEGGPL